MKREPRWISRSAVLAIHERLLADHGGAAGLRDPGLLDSALAGPRNRLAYGSATLFELAAALAHGISRNHPFVDGNKRLALTLAGALLELNGFRLEATEPDAVAATVGLASGAVTGPEFAAWLRSASTPLQRQGTRNRAPGSRKKK